MMSKMLGQIESVKNGTTSVEAIVRERLALLKQHKSCNAVICYRETELIAEATALDAKIRAGNAVGKLCGAVITVKDNLEVKGLKATAGMKAYENNIPDHDCDVVAKLRAEGAIILGKTNMPAGAMDMQTFNDLYGRTNHPDFPEYTCGGSSGGGAAAVKLGISDADIGNDFMGSIRVPSHFCGIYGMIGTDKVIPFQNMIGGKPHGSTMSNILRIGIQASTLQDLSLLFSLLADQSKLFPAKQNAKQLKMAYTKDCGGLPISKEYTACFANYIEKLSKKYIVTELDKSAFDFVTARECFLKLLYSNIAISLPAPIRILMGSKMTAKLKDYLLAEETRDDCIARLDALYDEYDVLLSPVTGTAAFGHKQPIRMRGQQAIYDDFIIDDNKVPYSVANMGYTTPFSLTGNPVIVVPIGKTDAGLPLGIQVVGRRGHEPDLERCAMELDNMDK